MSAWTKSVANMAGLDFETTGVDVFTDRIVTASFVTISPDREPSVHEWLVNPGVDIPEAATAVHGISTEQAKAGGCEPGEAVTAIVGGLRNAMHFADQPAGYPVPVVVFNAAFDLSMLYAECRRWGVEPLDTIGPVIDPFVVDKAVDRYRKGGRKLTDLCAHYGVRLDDAHQSTGDVLGTLRLAWAMARLAEQAIADPTAVAARYADRKYPGELVRAWQRLGAMTLGELHEAQSVWYREQAENFAAYLRREAVQKRHEADQADGDDARAVALQEAAELDARVDSLSYEWPIRSFAGQGVPA